jgi:hypothetical protein
MSVSIFPMEVVHDNNTVGQVFKIVWIAMQFEFHGAGHNVALGALPPVH